ncbi:MAG: DUF493 domain-containing protein [Proteobacteria bacterium]|nr:DUF493 domain-containing protein [Pseudomonadota bacterium]
MKLINPKPSSTAQDHPEIQYPCTWVYKVIGEDLDLLKAAITEACSPHPVIISHSHSSSKGKYHSFNAELVVPDEMVRLKIYELLKNNSAVRIVL